MRIYKQARTVAVVLILLGGVESLWGQTPRAERYVWRAVTMGGGGFVDGIIFHPTVKDLMYARTDVGGAYRWDAADGKWVALNDWLSAAQFSFTGIESIALDPSDPDRLYLAAGIYRNKPAAILRSDNQGRTFQIFATPFKMGGNEGGRSNGERLAVDPNDGRILFFGSRHEGLWKSGDRGAIWNRIESFPQDGGEGVGIVSVVFENSSGRRGSPTPVIYAAVSTSGTDFFRSDDAGDHWQAVAGQPVGRFPSHAIRSTDGIYYLTYGSSPGPNNVRDGAVWKYNPGTGLWTDITPEKSSGQPLGWGYGGVSVDAQHSSTIVVSTIDRWTLHDEVFRSTDGGTTWRGILLNGPMDYSAAPYSSRIKPHWMGALVINPTNPDQILFGTGYGIWCSTNATRADSGGRVNWIFLDNGLEETVPLSLISPTAGAHLISGVGDIDGFRHEDLDVSPREGTFAGTRFTNTRSLAYAGRKPEIMVRLGSGGNSPVHAAISDDGGKTWALLGSDAPGGTGSRIAISADGASIVVVVQHGSAFVTYNRGATWTKCSGFTGWFIVADPVNAARFYGFDTQSGKLLSSANAGASFEPTAAWTPNMETPGRGGGGILAVATGREGDIWVGGRFGGLCHSTNGGASFSKVVSVDSAEALGFGKAAPGRTYPAVYLLGSINGLLARYRSDDMGKSWVRIDDNRHQFVWADVPLISGDPRVYGRVYITTGGRGIIYGEPAPDTK